jgi:anti-sigma factor RsiW
MICLESRELIHAYLDGELDLVRSLDVERHLPTCQACSRMARNQQALRSAITTGSFYYQAPADLHQRVRSAVRQVSRTEKKPWLVSWRWLSAGVSLVAVAILILALTPTWMRQPADDVMTKEVVSAHVRSLMADHIFDVASSDRHTVKPWFNGRLDFSPPVTDLTQQGFALIGGRLDYLDNRPVAALVYRRQQHIINLFIWPSAEALRNAALKGATQQGYHLFRWTASGMTYWAVSDLNGGELKEFVGLVRDQVSPRTAP